LEDEKNILAACKRGDAMAFDALYHRFAPKMLVVCTRYARDRDEAKDLLQDGFIRVFDQLHTFRGEGSLEGWIRRVIVSVGLANYQKNSKIRNQTFDIDSSFSDDNQPFMAEEITSQIAYSEMLLMIQDLPPAYKMAFNLYVFEGFKHHEIAQKLNISEGTSKSNLFQAKRILQERITKVMFNL
jgi:RNA polymerase sigma-70 factor, ECF subfamily